MIVTDNSLRVIATWRLCEKLRPSHHPVPGEVRCIGESLTIRRSLRTPSPCAMPCAWRERGQGPPAEALAKEGEGSISRVTSHKKHG